MVKEMSVSCVYDGGMYLLCGEGVSEIAEDLSEFRLRDLSVVVAV